ncbi:MAG: hypothetical protein F4153_00935 [Acidimicrobiia bacterium]|nr:hypothetical protein [Acidimicrobiia bacterium]
MRIGSYEDAAWERQDDTHDCHKPILGEGTTFDVVGAFIDVGEAIADGLKTAYDEMMRAICTETGQFLTENVAGLGTTVLSGGNVYIGIGSTFIVDKALEYQCSQRRSSYGTHQNAVLQTGCTSDGKFTASTVTGLAVNYKSPKTYKNLYEYGGSLLSGEFLENACDALSTDPNAEPVPPPPFRTPTPTPTPTPEATVPTSATVSGNNLTLTFNQDLGAINGTTAQELRFAFFIDGAYYLGAPVTNQSPSRVAVSGRTVTLTLGTAVAAGDEITVTYVRAGLQEAGGTPVKGFTTTLTTT